MNTQERIENYKKFMFNPDNAHKCEKCPENVGNKSPDHELQLPCGQYRCWVNAHCKKGGQNE